jgi:hypothetical protein
MREQDRIVLSAIRNHHTADLYAGGGPRVGLCGPQHSTTQLSPTEVFAL